MCDSKKILPVLLRDGSSQAQRLPAALNPASLIQVDERSLSDLLAFAKAFAAHVRFYTHVKPDGTPCDEEQGTWTEFFDFNETEIIKRLKDQNDFDPYFALYLAFLQLFQFAQNDINGFTQKHVDFYYKEVLGLQPFKGKPDEVHVLFELAKNVAEQFIAKDTTVDAGKDATGNKQTYKLLEDILVNDATISDIRSVFAQGSSKDVLHYATVTNSGDGVGGKLDPADPKWNAFTNTNWPVKKVGFALAASILELHEGTRSITVTANLSVPDLIVFSSSSLIFALEIYLTGEKGWIGPYSCTPKLDGTTGKMTLNFTCDLTKDDPAVVPFSSKVHSGKYNTTDPVMQVLFSKTTAGNLLGTLKYATVDNVMINVDVKGVTSLSMENDQGVINAKKPFTPFGSNPVVGSSFHIGYSEIMKKKMDYSKFKFSFRVNWLDAPERFSDYYKYYKDWWVVHNSYFHASYAVKGGYSGITNLFNATNAKNEVVWPDHENDKSIWDSMHADTISFGGSTLNFSSATDFASQPGFFVLSSPMTKNSSAKKISGFGNSLQLSDSSFQMSLVSEVFFPGLSFIYYSPDIDETKEFIHFELSQEFYHKEYPGLYAVSMKTATDTSSLPNQPYTPTIKTIELDYEGSTHAVNISTNEFSNFQSRELALYHIGIFGEAEQHGFLKKSVQDEINKTDNTRQIDSKIYLVPQYLSEGELYLGLTKAEPDQTLAVLFQLADGSSNPEKEKIDVRWSVLCNNEWLDLLETEIVSDDTNHLLHSGIINFMIPEYATNGNTWLDDGKLWLRGIAANDSDAVCQFINLHVQAVKAVKVTPEDAIITSANTLTANTISKLVNKIAVVKKVQQPYTSFNGIVAENESQFYTRVSERLRHKDRAVTAWDYEHLVLQQFPSVYKVKCLNHSSLSTGNECCTERQPGHVTLILVPDLKNKNAVNPLQPKVNGDTIAQIEDFLTQRNSMFLKDTTKAQNPEYQEVLLDFKVRFNVEGNFGYHSGILNQAIVEFLSPWAFDSKSEIKFGGKAIKSVLINFIEEQEYVDFVTQVNMYHITEDGQSADSDEIIVTNPRAILVSAAQHTIRKLAENENCA